MRRIVLALAVTASLSHTGLLDPIAHLLASLWNASASSDAGCIWDPYGCPQGS